MAGTTGLEPATSAVTGQHSNQLNYVPNLLLRGMDSTQSGSALGTSTVYQSTWAEAARPGTLRHCFQKEGSFSRGRPLKPTSF